MAQAKVFVIIVAFNGMEWYRRCFESLRHSTIPITTIVVDNCSSDGTADFIRREFPEIVLIESSTNLGFGKGNNMALSYAIQHNCDYVFLLNQDTWLLDVNVIEELVRIHEHHVDYGILSPMHLSADEKGLWMLWENNNNLCSCELVSDLYCHNLKDIYQTNYVNAAAWLLPRRTIETVGGFDPIFQHYEEDDDYLNRVCFHKLKIGVCPSVRIVHDHRKELKNPFQSTSRYHREQQLLVQLNDINQPKSVSKQLRFLVRKVLSSFFGGNFRRVQSYILDIRYVMKMCHIVSEHRKINRTSGHSWIVL